MKKLVCSLPFAFGVGVLAAVISPAAATEKAAPLTALGKLPVKELTVFKDGHVFVAHEGSMTVDGSGNILMDYLPAPIIGTFWPYSSEKGVRLSGVVASQRRVLVQRTALQLRELLEANVGAEAIITEPGANHYSATIVGFPSRRAEELGASNPPNSAERLPEKGNLILLKTSDGMKAVNLERIQDVTFKNEFRPSVSNEEFRDLLTLKLNWNQRPPAKTANVGLLYLQKGVRWIPSYKVTLDGKGNALVSLQATILNELTDLSDVSVNLVIGVPSFAFKDTLDPMALQQTAAQLSQYFQNDARGNLRNSALGQNLSNAVMTQTARMGDFQQPGGEPGTGGPDLPEGTKTEDLFVFSLKHITLKKGERMVVPVTEFTIPYQDIYTLDLPFGPPPEVRGNLNTTQQQELARLFNAPKVTHKIRLMNKGDCPLTTAPALLVRDDRVLSQGMMTYTAISASTDLPVTTAVDIQVEKSDSETERTPNAVQHDNSSYARVDLTGKITLTNHHGEPVDVEITRHVLGNAEKASHDGVVTKVNVFDNGAYTTGEYPHWWNWYGWPSWWNYFNGVARIEWKTRLDPGKDIELGCRWHYFWR
ncbi:MAG: hypothetical protein ACR2OZ_13170 [Verrucomicrobiales bacterium]